MLVLSGLSLIVVLALAVFGPSEDDSYEARLPFLMAAVACGAIFAGVKRGYEELGWFVIAVLVLLIPSLRRALHNRQDRR